MAHQADQSVTREVQIANKLGLHARPAMQLVELANSFKAAVTVSKEAQIVDGKSIMQVMLLAATCGTDLVLTADGPDAADAIEALAELIERKFDEE